MPDLEINQIVANELECFGVEGAKKQPDVAEVFCRDRFTSECPKYRLNPGFALDLSTGWDFNREEHRAKALELLAREEPHVRGGESAMHIL